MITTEGHWKILRLFYQNKSSQIHLREIARQTKLHEPSVTRFLKSLEKEKILVAVKEGNLKKYSLRKNKKVYALLALLDVEKQEKLNLTRKNGLSSYFRTLTPPVFAILFGSTAKETNKEDSDIDILIVTNDKIGVKKAEREADAAGAVKISTFQINYADFLKELKLKEDKVVQSAINTGYPLINHISYYEVLFDERI